MSNHNEEPALGRLTTNTQPTWQTNSSNTSTSSAIRYALDSEDPSPILVYRWNDGMSVEKTTQQALCEALDRNRSLRVTKMSIPKRTTYIEVKRHDLFMPYEHEKYREFPNYNSSLASIRLPSNVYWSRNLFGTYDKLYIVSPETSPVSSPSGSFATSEESGTSEPPSEY
ncbi:hypothetical protein BDZ85DRAFT_255163 [Elsinoe ampelina]|uniref:Uncharacterized protein n=1 Tax=Elsinoe ampelina TaxID=302913 RepID=A0A6A6GRI0_9PEZI|nr:hypothetical protein BDZ85DRAFT_255163 [Elsinoe ampelina]